jgi:hypothetical protein
MRWCDPRILIIMSCFSIGCAFRPVDCSSHRVGRFQEEVMPGLWSEVVRSDTGQVERVPADGYEARYRLRWKNAFTYQLFGKEVVQGSASRPGSAGDTLTVTMLGVDRKGFHYIASSNYSELVLEGRQERVR